jgi:hypothetical protein
MTFPRLPGNGGNVHAGKKLLPGFHILFLRRRNRVNRLKKKPLSVESTSDNRLYVTDAPNCTWPGV